MKLLAAGNQLLAANTSSKEIHTLQTSKNPILKDIQGKDSFPDFARSQKPAASCKLPAA
ncbi:MAG TPA: hypothetical protein VFC67_16025 [Prolixibacteraceae bacterium]|nr:hypothetical protein [Prolixibacteraceae bacterium]